MREKERMIMSKISVIGAGAVGATVANDLMIQGIATSIDALSTGFTTSAYSVFQAFISSLIIAIVTFVICIAGVKIGKKFGVKLAGKAQILGGVILILIGLKICFIG